SLLSAPHDLYVGLHDSGLSWAVAIPLAALLVRGLLLFPLVSVPTRRAQQRYLMLAPILSGWKHINRRTCQADYQHHGPTVINNNIYLLSKRFEETAMREARCQTWRRNWGIFAQLPVFLLMANTMRLMCGSEGGFLSDIVKGMSAPTRFQNLDLPTPPSASSWFEPTMMAEGLSWCKDLTDADPYFILPALVSSTMFMSVYITTKAPMGFNGKPLPLRPAQAMIRRTLLGASVMIFPFILEMPSGVLLYWWTSSLCTLGSNTLLDVMFPLR
ncbi:hypothetical protein K402DRAFT_308940, partial [Aulographum hederae CBS 113979]